MTTHTRPSRRANLARLAALCFVLSACSTPPAPQGCGAEIKPEMLIGQWSARIDGESGTWALALAPHPEHLGSLRGELRKGPLRYPVVADLDDGEFTMEESHDGQRIAATWLGRVQSDRCAPTITGQRHEETAHKASPISVFSLEKLN